MTAVKKHGLLAGLLIVALGAGIGLGVMQQNGSLQRGFDTLTIKLFGQYMPEFSLSDLKGELRSSSEWQDNVVVLNFWATWCPPCTAEMPMFDALQDEYEEAGVKFVGIAIDNQADIETFITEKEIGYEILMGNPDSMTLSKSLGNKNGGLPFTAVFDRAGKLVATVVGEVPRERLNNLLAVLTSS
ncbi:TlpA family protein disulfide reductase [Solemya velum gill symbiont]|nr:TlpA disulfide reductase family protein [Solemya velum gill symbiont]